MRGFYWILLFSVIGSLNAVSQTFSLVKDIRPGAGSANPGNFITVTESVYFQANDGIHGAELWKSNGQEAGTLLIKDINPGSASGNPSDLLNINGTVYFKANDGIHGDELWKTDGTEAGTKMVKDISPGTANSNPSRFIKINNYLFFSAADGSHGTELWKTDGTEAGTVLVKDIYAGTNDGNPQYMINMGGFLFFSATDGIHAGYDLWRSNGTEAGTVLVKDIYPGSATAIVANLVSMGNKLFFTAGGDPASTLWKSDGTEIGTEIVKGFIFPLGLANINGTLFFQGRTTTEGVELWKTDGTEAGTSLVKDIRVGTGSSNPQNLVNVEGTLFFQADDGTGYKLWTTDGSETGTKKIKNISPENMVNAKGTVYFSAWEGTAGALNDKEIWKSDGTEAGTLMVQDIANNGGSSPSDFTLAGLKLFVAASGNATGKELWMADLSTPVGGLPLTMVDFKGLLSGSNVLLSWKTVAEHNTSRFEIERSLDGRFFSSAASVTAAGNSTITKQYEYTDHHVTTIGSSAVYYRLKMVDTDGKFTFSRTVAIHINNNKETMMMLYPNPVSENTTLMISALKKGDIVYSIIDQRGRVVQQKNVSLNTGSNTILIETTLLAAGIYTISLKATGMNSQLKFVKQ